MNEWERWQVASADHRDRFISALAEHPELVVLWQRWRDAESQLIDAGRARRESKDRNG